MPPPLMDRRRIIILISLATFFGLLLAGLSLLEKQYNDLRQPLREKHAAPATPAPSPQ